MTTEDSKDFVGQMLLIVTEWLPGTGLNQEYNNKWTL